MNKIKKYDFIKYGFLAFPLAFVGLPIYLHAPDFYASNFSLRIEYIGLALLLLRIFDAIQDPIIGMLCDKFHHNRRAIMLWSSLTLSIGVLMLFNVWEVAPFLWFCLSVAICTTAFSVISINLQAAGGLWEVASSMRPKIMTIREAMGLLGLLVASLLPAILMLFYDSKTSFFYLSLIFLPLIAIGLFLFLRWLKIANIKKPTPTNLNFKDILTAPNSPLFFTTYALNSLAASIPAVLIIFFVRDYLQAEKLLGLFLLIYFLCGAAAMAFWIYLSHRYSVLWSWWWSMLLALITFIWAYFLSPGDVVFYSIICASSGMSVGANLALPSAIVADFFRQNHHTFAAARYYAVMAFVSKAALALAGGLALPILGYFGYVAGQVSHSNLLPIVYALLPCVIQAFAIFFLWKLIKGKNYV